MIGRRKSPEPAAPPEPAEEKGAGKGRPTPTRKEAQARNRRPLVPQDRAEAKRLARQQRNDAFQRQREAMASGNDRYLPPRDKGPVRRFARDWVDARWSLAEFFMPLALIMMVLMFVAGRNMQMANTLVLGMYGLLLVAILDSAIMARRMRGRAVKKFGADRIPPWTAFYAFGRSFYLRRMRQPKPQVGRGRFAS